jgi:hypothetical protein
MRSSLLEAAKDKCAKYDEEQSYRALQERVKKKRFYKDIYV